jgi:hypothetical protein
MLVAQLGHNGDRVETRIFGERRRDDLEGFCERLETVGFLALERLGVLGE